MPTRQRSAASLRATRNRASILSLHLTACHNCTRACVDHSTTMAALTFSQAQGQRAAPVTSHKQTATFRLRPCTLVHHPQSLPLRQPRQQFVCRAASQQQHEQQSFLGFDRDDASIIDVTPEEHVHVEVVSPVQQEAETPARWKLGQRLAKGAAVFALAMALVSIASSLWCLTAVL